MVHEKSFKYEIGSTVKDKVTGFKGVVMGQSHYFTGCDHYGLLSSKLGKDSKPMEWEWFDETRLVLVKGIKKVKPTGRATSPGPNAPSMN